MGRLFFHIALLAWGALALTGCGLADVRSPVPEFMRAKAADPAPPEPPPDIKGMLRDNVESVFTAASRPSHVRVSAPRHEPVGAALSACVKAELNSVMGKPLGTQTYRITISEGSSTGVAPGKKTPVRPRPTSRSRLHAPSRGTRCETRFPPQRMPSRGFGSARAVSVRRTT